MDKLMDESISWEDAVKEILCVIHRDGGQYFDKHGLAKASRDAIIIHRELLDDVGSDENER